MMFNTVFCVAGAVLLNIAGCLGQLDICGRAPLNTKIYGGVDATEGSWPWQASINSVSTQNYFCTGSLINNEWVLTSASCIMGNDVADIVVYLGRLTQKGPNPHETSRTVIQVIKHPSDNSFSVSIALLKLSSSVTFSEYIKPVCLAAAGSVFVNGTESWVAGWGWISEFRYPDVLQEVKAPIVNNIECDTFYEEIITDNLMCAGFVNENGKAPCESDDGAPLVTKEGSQWIQSGVMIKNFCGFYGTPTVYVRVSEYEDWIRNYTSSSLPGFVSYPVIYTITDGGSVSRLSFPLALTTSIIALIIISRFF